MWLVDVLQNDSGDWYVYELEEAPNTARGIGAGDTAEATASDATVEVGTAGFAEGAGVTASGEAAEGEGLGHAVVTIKLPVNTGPRSIFYPDWFEGEPQEGDTITYPTTNGLVILPDGTAIAEDYGSWECVYDDGDETYEFTLVIDANAYVFADGATAEAEASDDPELYGGVNISGGGQTVTAAPSTGGATVGTIATGGGSTATTGASDATVSGPANVEGAGVEVEAISAEGVGEVEIQAEGAGDTVEATAAEATVEGDVNAEGEGVVVTAIAAEARATGDLLPGSIPYAALTVVYPRTLLIARAAA